RQGERVMAAIRARAARLFRYALAASLLGAIPRLGLGLAFAPTEAEWIMWPDYCKARYVVSASGQDSAQFAGRVDAVVVKAWERRLGTEVWYSLHHYCAGMLIAERAKRMSGPERQLALRE